MLRQLGRFIVEQPVAVLGSELVDILLIGFDDAQRVLKCLRVSVYRLGL